jgi:hypothetical protein
MIELLRRAAQGTTILAVARPLVAGLIMAGPLMTDTAASAAERPKFAAHLPQRTAEEAFAGPYGEAIVKELAGALLAAADKACLAAKDLDEAKLAAAGRALLVKYGQRMTDHLRGLIDARAAETRFERAMGAGATAELAALAGDPAVKRLTELAGPGELDRLAGLTIDIFDRYATAKRLGLRNVSPLAAGSDLPKKSRQDESEQAAAAFIKNAPSPSLARYLKLVEAAQASMASAVDRTRNLAYGPLDAFEGADAELREICVGGAN